MITLHLFIYLLHAPQRLWKSEDIPWELVLLPRGSHKWVMEFRSSGPKASTFTHRSTLPALDTLLIKKQIAYLCGSIESEAVTQSR